ncbi:unnamed protein product [Amoebophrya sp. A120]|nr:unnamed protein product [Amoebophrya sp. A120]|eukprot:GSA120T00022422001.1
MHDHTNHVVASDTQMKAWAVSNKADGAMALIGAELSSGHCVAKVIALLPVVCRSLRMTQGALGAMHPAARGLGPSPAPCSCGAHCGAGKGARRGGARPWARKVRGRKRSSASTYLAAASLSRSIANQRPRRKRPPRQPAGPRLLFAPAL